MIYERSIILFVWAISVILISSEVSSANASKQISNYSLSKHISLVKTEDIEQRNRAVSPSSADSKSVIQSSEPPEVRRDDKTLNKRWTGLGIGVTSVFFCLLLWILFQPNSQIKNISTSAKQNDDEQDNKIDLQNDPQVEFIEEVELLEEVEFLEKVEFEEEVNLPPLFSLKEDNLIQKSSDELTVVQQAHLVREKQPHPNLNISEDIQDPTKEQKPIQIDAENQRLVRTIATNTSDIDVVFELIQDLKKSDRKSRRKAIWDLAQTGDSRSIEPLIDIIPIVNNIDKSLVLSAISQIAHRNFEPIYDILFTSLQDPNSEIRKDAIRDITALHDSTTKITRHLFIMLKDSDKEVRQTANWALKRINLGSLPQSEKYTANKAIPTDNKSKQN